MPNSCAFCGSTAPLTHEHVFGQWVSSHPHTRLSVGYSTISQATSSLTLTSRGRRNSSRVGHDTRTQRSPRDQSRGQLSRQDLVRQSPNRLCRRVRKFVQTTSENDTGHQRGSALTFRFLFRISLCSLRATSSPTREGVPAGYSLTRTGTPTAAETALALSSAGTAMLNSSRSSGGPEWLWPLLPRWCSKRAVPSKVPWSS